MKDLISSLHEALQRRLQENDLEVLGILPLPNHEDKMLRLRTLQDMIDDFETTNGKDSIGYLVQVRQKPAQRLSPQNTEVKDPSASVITSAETIYLANGKLNASYRIKNGDLLFDSGDIELARNIYHTLLKSGESPSTPLHRLGKCLEAEGKLDEAIAKYEESIAYQPSLEVYQQLATLLMKQNKDQHAAELLERASHLKDLGATVRFELLKTAGNCWTRAQNPENAEKAFKKSLELNPTADDIRSNLGILYLRMSKIQDAKRNFRDALASNPRNYQALAGLGSCCLAEGDKKSAHDYFSQSLEIELNNPSALFYLVKCAYEIKNYSTAARILENYTQSAPVNSNLLYSLAGLQFHLGRIPEAKKTTQKILELQPSHDGAKELVKLIEKYSSVTEDRWQPKKRP